MLSTPPVQTTFSFPSKKRLPDLTNGRPVALHELGHWTGHRKRLNRDLTGRFGSGAYAQEELRAELASAFVGTVLGLPTDIPHHASSIANWIAKLREDKREIFRAAADAQKIADLALGFHPDYAASLEPAGEQSVGMSLPRPALRSRNDPQA